jgi:outer membrane protein
MNFKLLLASAFILVNSLVYSQENESKITADTLKFSITQAKEYALNNNLTIKNAFLDLESAKQKILETTAIGLPQANFNGNYQNIFKVPQISFGGGVDYSKLPASGAITKQDLLDAYTLAPPVSLGVKENVTWDITISQLIFSGEYIVGLQASRIFKQMSEQTLTKTQFDVKSAVEKAYYLVLVTESNLKIYKQNLVTTNNLLSDMEAIGKQGLIESTDVDQIRINKMNIENLINSIQESAKLSYRFLKLQMGIELNQPIVLTDSLPSIKGSENFQLWSSADFGVDHNIDFELMQTNEYLNALSLKREKSKLLPTITGAYRHQELLNTPSFNFNFPNVISVGVSFPIFSSGMRISRIKQANFALEKSINSKNQVRQALQTQFEQSLSNYNNALNTYQSLKEGVILSEKIYNSTLLKYKEGMVGSQTLSQTQSQFLTTEYNLYNSMYNVLFSKIELEKLLATE